MIQENPYTQESMNVIQENQYGGRTYQWGEGLFTSFIHLCLRIT